jgi:integrase
MSTRQERPVKRINPSGATRWVARWTDKTGKRRIGWPPDIKGTYPTRREAQDAINRAYERDVTGPARPDTVGAYAKTWTSKHPRSTTTNKTNDCRLRAVLDVELDGVPFSRWPFEALKRRQANDLADHMLRVQGRAYTGVNNILESIGSMVEDAIDDEVAVHNPFRGMKKIRANDPRVQKARRKIRAFPWADMHRFARACADAEEGSEAVVAWRRVYAEPMVRCLSDLGLRLGELLPLCVQDVNFGEGLLEVRWSVSLGEVLPGTKTDHGEEDAGRVVPVPPDLLRMLDGMPRRLDAVVRRGEEVGRLLFPTQTGRLWSHQEFRRMVWVPGQELSGLDVRPHEMRHSYVSLLRAARIDPADLADASGHSVETASKTYTHALNRSFDEIRRAVGE